MEETRKGIFSLAFNLPFKRQGSIGDDGGDENEVAVTTTTAIEEDSDFEDNVVEEVGGSSQRHILTFSINPGQTNEQKKILYLNLYKGTITEHGDMGKYSYRCSQLINVERIQDNQILIELQCFVNKLTGVRLRSRKFHFKTIEETEKFHQYLEYLLEAGEKFRKLYDGIDLTKKGEITTEDLSYALRKVNLPYEDLYIQKMMALARIQSSLVDFYGFFHTLRHSYVTTVHDSLLEWLLRAHPLPSLQHFQIHDYYQLLPGEQITFQPNERIYYTVYNGKKYSNAPFFPGQIIFTNYRLLMVTERQEIPFSTHSRYDLPAFFKVISLPFVSIQKLKVIRPRNVIMITTKLFYQLQLILFGCLHNQSKVDTFVQMITGMAFLKISNNSTNNHTNTASNPSSVPGSPPGTSSPYQSSPTLSRSQSSSLKTQEIKAYRQHYFAFQYKPLYATGGWELRDLMKEYYRQGLLQDSSPWKVIKNDKYEMIESYPFFLVIPQAITVEQLRQAASFRSQNRVPVITYLHRETGAVLIRSSQPLVGMSRKSSPEDALLLNYYRLKGQSQIASMNTRQQTLYIMDCRGRIAAGLNMISGKGTEEVTDYINTQLIHGNIENIHEIRNTAKQLTDSLTPTYHPYQDLSGILSKVSEIDYHGMARWIKHLRQILAFAMMTVEKLVLEGNSVLVHCSDGWDRTTQICALAQILIDPYYRTIEGLAVLIEKEWCSFGHKFKDRTGCGLDPTQSPDERSPIFLQFLDCLYQLLIQFPSQFEYHSDLLVFLVNHYQSGLFGNFLGNTEKERIWELSVHMYTRSIWDYILAKKEAYFLNPTYDNSSNMNDGMSRPLWPSLSIHRFKLWERIWNRWNVTGHPSSYDNMAWFDDW